MTGPVSKRGAQCGAVPGPSEFGAPWWAKGPHAQTLLARALRPSECPPMTRERVETPDGDFLDVDWSPDPGPDAPVALILHGLEGCSERKYVRNVCRALFDRGVRALAMNFRGCSGEPNRALHFYHSGASADPLFLLDLIRARHPGRRIGAMGFSLGGNMLLKLMGEREDGGVGVLDAAVAMSVPYDLDAGCALLEQSFMGRAYSGYFLRSLRRKVESKRDRLAAVIDIEAAESARTIRDFDEAVTAPLNGFASAEEYYRLCSSGRFLSSVRVPTLLLHAWDDPFLPAASIPAETARDNPATELRLSPTGGHVGFIHGSPLAPKFWADEAGAVFLAETLAAG